MIQYIKRIMTLTKKYYIQKGLSPSGSPGLLQLAL